MNEATQRLIDRFKETRNEIWLTQAALNCIHSDEPLPDGITWYIHELLLRREKELHIDLKKRDTINHNEWYIREVRDLIFLTGAKAKDACHRVSNVNTLLHGSREKVPAAGTLQKLWDHRDERWKKDPVIKASYEWAVNWFGEYCKPEHGIYLKTKDGLAKDKVTLEIKRDLFVIVQT